MSDNNDRIIRLPVILLGLSVAFSLFGDMAIYAILPVYYRSLSLTPIQVGLLLSVNRWIRLATNDLARRYLDDERNRRLFVAALAAGSVVAALYSAVPPFWLFLILRGLWGFCWSVIRHFGMMGAVGTGSRTAAGRIVGTYNGLVQLGFIAGTALGGIALDAAGFSSAFLVMAAVSALGIPFGFASVSSLETHRRPPGEAHDGGRLSFTLMSRGFVSSFVGTGLVMSTLGYVLSTTLGGELRVGGAVIGIATVNAVLLALRYVINSAGSPAIGVLIDRIGIKRCQLFGFTAGTVTLFVAALSGSGAAVVAAVIAFFLAATAAVVSLTTEAGLSGSKEYARYVTVTDIGAAAGPLLGWIGIDMISGASVSFFVGGALYAAAAALSLIGWRRRVGR